MISNVSSLKSGLIMISTKGGKEHPNNGDVRMGGKVLELREKIESGGTRNRGAFQAGHKGKCKGTEAREGTGRPGHCRTNM